MDDKLKTLLDSHYEMIEVLGLFQKFICEKSQEGGRFTDEYIQGYYDSFGVMIDYLYELTDELQTRSEV